MRNFILNTIFLFIYFFGYSQSFYGVERFPVQAPCTQLGSDGKSFWVVNQKEIANYEPNGHLKSKVNVAELEIEITNETKITVSKKGYAIVYDDFYIYKIQKGKYDRVQIPQISKNRIQCAYIDESDILWLGLDGKKIVKYSIQNRKTSIFTVQNDYVIRDIKDDKLGNIWIAGTKNIIKLKKTTGQSEVLISDDYFFVEKIVVDSKNNLFVMKSSGKIIKIEGRVLTEINTEGREIIDLNIKNDTILVATRGNIFAKASDGDYFTFLSEPYFPNGLKGFSLCNENDIWIVDDQGLFMKLKNNKFTFTGVDFSYLTSEIRFMGFSDNKIFLKTASKYWLTTFDGKKWQNFEQPIDADLSWAYPKIDKKGNPYMIHENKLYKLQGNSFEYLKFGDYPYVRSIEFDKDNSMWVLNGHGLFQLTEKGLVEQSKKLKLPNFSNFKIDNNNRFWLIPNEDTAKEFYLYKDSILTALTLPRKNQYSPFIPYNIEELGNKIIFNKGAFAFNEVDNSINVIEEERIVKACDTKENCFYIKEDKGHSYLMQDTPKPTKIFEGNDVIPHRPTDMKFDKKGNLWIYNSEEIIKVFPSEKPYNPPKIIKKNRRNLEPEVIEEEPAPR